MVTIGRSLNYKIAADTSGFTRGVIATKKELREATRVMDQTRTPAERYRSSLDRLHALFRKGAIDQDTYTRRLRQLRLEKLRGIPVVGRFASGIAGAHPALLAAGVALAAFTTALMVARRAVHALTEVVKTQLDEIDKLAKSARSLQITSRELVGLRMAAAEFSGMTSEQFDKALKKMIVQLGDASRGTGNAKLAIEQLGLSVTDMQKRSPAEQFKTIAEAVAGIEDPTRRAWIAQQLFGRSGVELINTLSAGRGAIEDVQRAADELGLTFSEVDAAKVEAANDAMARAKSVFVGLGRDLTIEVAPALKIIADELVAATDESSQFGKTLRTAIDMVGPGLAITGDALNTMVGFLQTIQGTSLELLNTTSFMAELVNSMAAVIPGVDRSEELEIFLDTFRNQAEALRREGVDRMGAGLGGDVTSRMLNSQIALNTEQERGGKLTEEQAEAAAELAEQMQKVQDKATSMLAQLQQRITFFDVPSGQAQALQMLAEGADQLTVSLILAKQAELDLLEQQKKVQEQTAQTQAQAENQLAALNQQIRYFGADDATKEFVATFDLLANGADEATVKLLRLAQAKLQQLKADDALIKRGEQITRSMMTPAEKVAEQIDELKQLYDQGAIDVNTYQRAIEKAREDLKPPVRTTFEILGIDAAIVGSQKAAEAIARFKKETEKNVDGGIRLDVARDAANRQANEPPKPRIYLDPTAPNRSRIIQPPASDFSQVDRQSAPSLGALSVEAWNARAKVDAAKAAGRAPEIIANLEARAKQIETTLAAWTQPVGLDADTRAIDEAQRVAGSPVRGDVQLDADTRAIDEARRTAENRVAVSAAAEDTPKAAAEQRTNDGAQRERLLERIAELLEKIEEKTNPDPVQVEERNL